MIICYTSIYRLLTGVGREVGYVGYSNNGWGRAPCLPQLQVDFCIWYRELTQDGRIWLMQDSCVSDASFMPRRCIKVWCKSHIRCNYATISPYLRTAVKECDAEFTLDHTVLFFGIYQANCKLRGSNRFVYNYKREDFIKIRHEIKKSESANTVRNSENVNSAWNKRHNYLEGNGFN